MADSPPTAIERIRERDQCSIHKAIDVLDQRIQHLKADSPDRFAPNPDGWEFSASRRAQ